MKRCNITYRDTEHLRLQTKMKDNDFISTSSLMCVSILVFTEVMNADKNDHQECTHSRGLEINKKIVKQITFKKQRTFWHPYFLRELCFRAAGVAISSLFANDEDEDERF
jgi:hypothetical protein